MRLIHKPDISVILACQNRHPSILLPVLESFTRSRLRQIRFETIIVDDGSDPGYRPDQTVTPELHQLLCLKLFRLENPGYGCASPALNVAISNAAADIVLVTGGDVVFDPDVIYESWLSQQWDSIPVGHSRVSGPTVWGLNEHGTDELLERLRPSSPVWPWTELVRPEGFPKGNGSVVSLYSGPVRTDPCSSSMPMHFCSCYRKDFLFKIGGFNEAMSGNGFEDCEFNKRVSLVAKPQWLRSEAFHLWHYHKQPGRTRSYSSLNKTIFEQCRSSTIPPGPHLNEQEFDIVVPK